jgi:malate dehydrogenase
MRKNKIALIGGGTVGTAFALMATQKEIGDIIIVDVPDNENVIKGKALDIMALRPHGGHDINITATADFSQIMDADIVVITAGIPRKPHMTRDDLLEVNLKIIQSVAKEIKAYAPDAFVIVSTNPVDTMSQAFFKATGFQKQRVVGLSGALDTGRFQNLIAMETGLSVKDISCMVMGGHGPTMIPLVRTATVAGIPLNALLSQEQIESVVERTRHAGTEIVNLLGNGSAYISSASAIMEMVEAYILDKKRVIASSVLCEGEYGINGYFIGVPCVIGAEGVERIIEFELDETEQEMFEKTHKAVKKCAIEAKL